MVYSLGCAGHGVSPTHLNGKTLCDMVLERKTELTGVSTHRWPMPQQGGGACSRGKNAAPEKSLPSPAA